MNEKSLNEILLRIGKRLEDIDTEEMTTAENQICAILIESGFGKWSEIKYDNGVEYKVFTPVDMSMVS